VTPVEVKEVGVLALQGDVEEHVRMLGELGADPVEVRNPGELDAVRALVIPGGESTAISLLLETSGLLDPLRHRVAEGMPVMGTCAGMILLARQIKGGRADQHQLAAIDITVRRNGYGRQVDSFETDLDVRGLDRPLHAVFIRAPLVERVGPGVEVLACAESPAGSLPAVCRQGRILVAAFHPELAGDGRLHQLFLETVAAPAAA
jgi:5'-phosphate synthase pdxT subunit